MRSYVSVGEVAGGDKPLRRDAAENRQRLLDAAATVFSERGLDVSVDEIARVAGVGTGTLYRRFPAKDALISELVRQLMIDLVALATEALEVTDGSGLEQVMYGTGEIQASQRGCISRMWNDDETEVLKNEYRRILSELLISAKDHGRIRDDAALSDVDLTFWALRGVIETTRGVSDTAWRRHLALVIAGMRPGAEQIVEPPMDERHVELAKVRLHAR
ncbi:helix-turn-helix domain-containing protein [Williamsia sp.]|uniref:TetR/AcrR family transcriptional regulator n=1 Tax=Williamsia sp. TaxID=1872085 RepID=UPI002F93D8A2